MSTKAVITDQTAKEILDELRIANAIAREQRDLMAESAPSACESEPEVHWIRVKCTAEADGNVYTLEEYTFDDLYALYQAGKCLIARIEGAGKVYFAPLLNCYEQEYSSRFMRKMLFYAASSPDSEGTLTLTHNAYTSGDVNFTVSLMRSGIGAEKVGCSVTIKGSTYNTLDAALTAIAAEIG